VAGGCNLVVHKGGVIGAKKPKTMLWGLGFGQ
jgi:hypothetical protein